MSEKAEHNTEKNRKNGGQAEPETRKKWKNSPKYKKIRRALIRSGKLFLWGLGVLCALLLLLLLFRNQIAEMVITGSGSSLLGTEVTVEDISSNIFTGKIRIVKLVIKNPPGFQEENFLRVDSISLDADMWSLLTSRIVVEQLEINNLELTGEFNREGTLNAKIINNSISGNAPPDESEATPKPEPKPKRPAKPMTYVLNEFNFSGQLRIVDDTSGIKLPFPSNFQFRNFSIEDDGESLLEWTQKGFEKFIRLCEKVQLSKFSDEVLKIIPEGGKIIIDSVKDTGRKILDWNKKESGKQEKQAIGPDSATEKY